MTRSTDACQRTPAPRGCLALDPGPRAHRRSLAGASAWLLIALLTACNPGEGDRFEADARAQPSPARPAETTAGTSIVQQPTMSDTAQEPTEPSPNAWHALDIGTISPDSGLAYGINLPEEFAAFASDSGAPTRSTLVIQEDGQPLGPANALHQLIRETGLGAFSHWGAQLLFSTSDNSDPRTNGRVYRARLE